MEKQLRGIALILFGLLIGIADGELNEYITMHSVGFVPFALVGLVVGIIGLVLVFQKGKDQ